MARYKTAHVFLVFAGWWAVERLGWRRPPGARVFGSMDDERREYTRRACPMIFPTEWNPLDWIHLAAGFAFIAGLAFFHPREDRRLARFAPGRVLTTVARSVAPANVP